MNQSFSPDYFLDKKTAESFVCGICYGIPHPDIAFDHCKCGSVFCYDCINKWKERNNTCPMCKTIFDGLTTYTKNTNRSLYNIMINLRLKCPFETPNCGWEGTFGDIIKHKENDSKLNDIKECPYKILGCKMVGTEIQIKQHLEAEAEIHAKSFIEFTKVAEAESKRLLDEKTKYNNALNDPLRLYLPGVLSNTSIYQRGPNPVVFMNIIIEGVCEARIVFHLFANVVPKTVENFRVICNGLFTSKEGRLLTYKGSVIHRIIPGFIFQGGDIINDIKSNKIGMGTTSIYGKSFPDENFTLKHETEGILSMANLGPNTNGCQFFVTLKPCPWLDGKNVVFGEVIEGLAFMKVLEQYGTPTGNPKAIVYISSCGQLI